MKKILIAVFTIVVCLCTCVSAADFVITDIYSAESGNLDFRVLTDTGIVFDSSVPSGENKQVIKTDVAALTGAKDVYLMKDGSIDYQGTVIKGLDVKKIICVSYLTSESSGIIFVDNSGALKVHYVMLGETITIIENFKDIKTNLSSDYYIKSIDRGLNNSSCFVTNQNNELYYWYYEISEYGAPKLKDNIKVQYITSDVVDFEVGEKYTYYMKSNGDVYRYDLEKNESVVSFRGADVSFGIEKDGSAHMVYANHNFYINGTYDSFGKFTLSNEWVAHPCQIGVLDMVIYNKTVYYIGSDYYLYCYNLSDHYDKEGMTTSVMSYNATFLKLYTPGEGIYALATDNSLYSIRPETGFEEEAVLNNISNAIPKKFSLSKYTFILTESGKCCYTVEPEGGYISESDFNKKELVVMINDKKIDLEAPIQIKNNRSMYPLRECFTAMGASVTWDAQNQLAIGELPGKKIEFPIGKNEYYINGVRHEMDVPSYIDGSLGRTYIPIRYAAEGLGFTVDWITGDIDDTISIH